jgi:hypothetical protein
MRTRKPGTIQYITHTYTPDNMHDGIVTTMCGQTFTPTAIGTQCDQNESISCPLCEAAYFMTYEMTPPTMTQGELFS